MSPAQRVTNAVWLRDQLYQLIAECDSTIGDLQVFINCSPHEGERLVAITKVHCTERMKQQLERVLRGECTPDDNGRGT